MRIMDFTKYTESQLIASYTACKDAYYNDDEPDMTDIEFDALEEHLIETYGFDTTVGAEPDSRRIKNKHWFPVLSLAKRKVGQEFTSADYAAVTKHYGALATSHCRMSLKLDGLAFSIQYQDGILHKITTRGNKYEGEDVTEKFKQLVPLTINYDRDIEVRAEAVIPWKVWYSKYDGKTKFKHPRNLAAGIKNDLNVNDPRVQDMHVVAVDMVTPYGVVYDPKFAFGNEFKVVKTWYTQTFNDVTGTYAWILDNRTQLEYPIDGVVVFASIPLLSTYKRQIKNGHNPQDAIALKFPAPKHKTIVTKIDWNLKRTGNYIPKIRFEPFTIDGRNIKQCTGYNYEYIVNNHIGVGSTIEIAISNDIIPVVYKTITKSTDRQLPDSHIRRGVHIAATEQSETIHWHKFCHAMGALNFKDAGVSAFKQLYSVLSLAKGKEQFKFDDIFDNKIINQYSMHDLGPNKSKKLIRQIQSMKTIQIHRVIYMHAIDSCGWRMSTQIGRKLSNIKYSFAGLTKNVVTEILTGATKTDIQHTISSLQEHGIIVAMIKDEEQTEVAKRYILTGSPKPYGFKTKSEFRATLPKTWQEVRNIKDADILITDDIYGTSNKMKYANEHGVEIETYNISAS